MDMKIIIETLIGVVSLSVLGFLLGIGLAFIAKIFKVKEDPVVEKVSGTLPGLNCGACGYPGCSGYAEALVNDEKLSVSLCPPGGNDTVAKLAEILGRVSEENDAMVAKVFCMGDDAIAKLDYLFNGEEDCLTVQTFFEGEKSCKYACVSKGDCIKVCPVGAIKRDELNRVWVDSVECVGCERCVSVCPANVIKMVPENGGHFVACSSHYNGKVVKDICQKGCIGCKICEKVAQDPKRITVTNNLAVIMYETKTDLHDAAVKCPANVIIPIETQKMFVKSVLEQDREKKANKEALLAKAKAEGKIKA